VTERFLGKREDRHHRPRHRPDLRRQDQPRRHPGPGPLRRVDPAAEGRGRARLQEPGARQGLQPPRDRPTRSSRSCWLVRGPARRPMSPTPRLLLNRRSTRARSCSARAARAPCSTSTTARTRSSPPPTRPRAAPAPARASADPDRPGDRHPQGLHHAGRRGPFPTELLTTTASTCARSAASTARPPAARRCGWFDAVIARYATRVNGVTDFFLTKLDVLTGWSGPGLRGVRDRREAARRDADDSQTDFHHAKPIYETLPGWWEDITQAKTFDDLPKNAQSTCRRWRTCPARPSRRSASARAGTRRSRSTRSSDIRPDRVLAARTRRHRAACGPSCVLCVRPDVRRA
jgi:hypothetical protein